MVPLDPVYRTRALTYLMCQKATLILIFYLQRKLITSGTYQDIQIRHTLSSNILLGLMMTRPNRKTFYSHRHPCVDESKEVSVDGKVLGKQLYVIRSSPQALERSIRPMEVQEAKGAPKPRPRL